MGRSLTSKEFFLAVALSLLGFVFSMRTWLLWLNTLNPFEGFIVYYIILYVSLFILSKAGLVVFGLKIDDPVQTLGLLLITFSFFLIVGFSSGYVQYVTTGSMAGASSIYYQCEDGMVWWAFSQFVSDIWVCRILTFVVTPFILTLIGGFLVSGKIKLH